MSPTRTLEDHLIEERSRTRRLNRYIVFLCSVMAVLTVGVGFQSWVIYDQRQSLSDVEGNQDRGRRERMAFQCQLEVRLGMDERSCP